MTCLLIDGGREEVDWVVRVRRNPILSELFVLCLKREKPSAQSSILSNFLNNGIYLKRYQITKHERNEWSMQNAFALLETCWNKRVSLPTNRNGQGGFLVLINMQTAKFMRFSRIFVPTREHTILNFSRRSLPLDLKHRELAGEHHKKPKWNPGILMF